MRLVSTLLLAATALGSGRDELQMASGARFSLAELLARGPVVLIFWNSWLPKSEAFSSLLPEIETAAESHGWPGAVVVFQEDNEAVVQRLATDKGRWPRVLDAHGELVRRFQVTRAPAILLVERNGSVRARCGPTPAEVCELERQLGAR